MAIIAGAFGLALVHGHAGGELEGGGHGRSGEEADGSRSGEMHLGKERKKDVGVFGVFGAAERMCE